MGGDPRKGEILLGSMDVGGELTSVRLFRRFRDWWWSAKGVDFVLVDEFDAMDRQILPFLAVPSSVLKKRAQKLQHDTDFWLQVRRRSLISARVLWFPVFLTR
jgi:hypothetical protein